MKKAGVVHLNSLVDEVRSAVREVEEGGPLLSGDPEIVMLKDPAIIGFVMPRDKLLGRNVGQLTDIATRIGKSAGGSGALIVHNGNIIVGFMPPGGSFEE